MREGWLRMWARRMLLPLIFGALAACSARDSVSGPQVQQYTLRTIDGHDVPYEVDRSSDGSVTYVVTDMVLSISDDHTWRVVGHRTVTTNGVASVQLLSGGGMYATSNISDVVLRNESGDIVWTGSFAPLLYELANASGQVYVFRQ